MNSLVYIALFFSKAERRVSVGWGGWCKPIIMSNPQPSYFGFLLGWVAVALLGFGVMTICYSKLLGQYAHSPSISSFLCINTGSLHWAQGSSQQIMLQHLTYK